MVAALRLEIPTIFKEAKRISAKHKRLHSCESIVLHAVAIKLN